MLLYARTLDLMDYGFRLGPFLGLLDYRIVRSAEDGPREGHFLHATVFSSSLRTTNMSKEWAQELTRLVRGGAALENGLNGVNSREGGEFALEQREIARQRDSTLHLIQKRLQGFKTSLKNIDNRLKSAREQKHGVYDPQDLQKYLESFESKLTSYKSSMRAEYDTLKNEEDRLAADVAAMTAKIEDWENNSDLKGHENHVSSAEQESKSSQRARIQDRYEKQVELQSKIGAIDRQLASLGGMYGGWDSRDHDAFVRSWVQSTSASAHQGALNATQRRVLMKRIIANVPVKTEEELDAHVDWYIAHLELSSQKKVLLDEWKASRRVEQARKYKSTLEEELDEEEKGLSGGPTSVFLRAEDREAQKLRIANWKKGREEDEQKKLLAAKETKLQEEQNVEDMKRKRQAMQRAKLDSWKKDEEKCKEAISRTKKITTGVAPRVTTAQLAERQKRDRELTQVQLARKEKMQDRALARDTKVRELAKGLSLEGTGVVAVKQDTERLRTGTKAFNQHKFETESIADAQRRRHETSAHSSHMAMHGRDLQGSGRMPAAWLNRK